LNWDDRNVVHLNVADFAAAVERTVDRRLRGRPVIVAASAGGRAAVFDMSEEAYQAGVRKGHFLRQARKICPDAQVTPPHPERYERAMTALFKHVRPYSPLIEAGEGNGHFFLDVTGVGRLHGPPADVAWRIRKAVRSDLGLEPIWSTAPNKLVAKVATRLVKPAGEYMVEAGEEADFLAPLPLRLLPGVDREEMKRLDELHVTRAGELARWTPEQLDLFFGRRGPQLRRVVTGVDPSPVLPAGRRPPAVVKTHIFSEDVNDRVIVEAALYHLVEEAGFDLREQNRAARRVAVALDYSDGVRAVRQRSAAAGATSDAKLFRLARSVLELAWTRRVRLRRMRLTIGRLCEPPAQMTLFPEEDVDDPRDEALSNALDHIRRRFGKTVITAGRTLPAA
jgi:DNA polymerase-4